MAVEAAVNTGVFTDIGKVKRRKEGDDTPELAQGKPVRLPRVSGAGRGYRAFADRQSNLCPAFADD